ncbi:MAG: GNAT family N-acetyltransferase [Euryarchaeota archaeon]|nr:GNAT family N-acetyltransferase [Euryarchaeota archaeon]MDE2044739.1 GNAT family N-acetyltransferase [Thermoplasmata archaeon]
MTSMAFRPPVVLQGRWVALVPLSREHLPQLIKAGTDPQIWSYMRYGPRTSPKSMEELVDLLLRLQEKGTDLAFTTFYRPEGVAVGMTRFLDIRREDRGVEIGGTWIAPRLWRTPVNTESKYLLLRHAFEVEGCLRVQFKTDLRNVRSQRAIERLGAVKEGVFRKHMALPNGLVRDSVFYSLTDDDWPTVKARLEGFLERGWTERTEEPLGRPE